MSENMTNELTLEDLVKLSGLPLRTLRFYIQEGILQGPDTHGKYARYSQQHLDRLKLIQRLKNLRLPIQEIRHLLNNMTPEEISQIREYQDVLKPSMDMNLYNHSNKSTPPAPGSSALEYIHDLERGRENINSFNFHAAKAPMPQMPIEDDYSPKIIKKRETKEVKDQETWKRVAIYEGIELNVREPMTSEEEEKVKKLIEMAQKLFGENS
jgi:DNA-binding transcriptional MerR regulator